jgi:hypothetical protein
LTSFAKTHGRTTLGLVHLVLFGAVAIAGGQPQRDVDREERGDDARDLSLIFNLPSRGTSCLCRSLGVPAGHDTATA